MLYIYQMLQNLGIKPGFYNDWILSAPKSRNDYVLRSFTDNLPIVGAYNRSLRATRDTGEYLNRYGMTWSDMSHYDRSPGYASAGAFYTEVSRNISRLYK